MYFSEPVLFEIPVRPRIRKFIHTHLIDALGRRRPMLVSSDAQGASLWMWALAQSEKVQLNTGWRRPKPDSSYLHTDGAGRIMAPDDMTDVIGLAIHEFHKSRQQYLLNYAELEAFSSWVDYLIRNELICFCEEKQHLPLMERIRQFADCYDFSEDDISEANLKQIIYRHGSTQHDAFRSFNTGVALVNHFTAYPMAA